MQPREKLIQKGTDALSDLELLAILIGTGYKGRSYRDVARSCLKSMRKRLDNGDLGVKDLVGVRGIGAGKACKIVAGVELGKRLYTVKNEDLFVADSASAYEILKGMGKLKQEQVRVLFLDGRYRLKADRVVAVGALNRVSIEPHVILSTALELNAVNLIMAHNHPTGVVKPSREDLAFTGRITEACKIVGIRLLDHLIIGRNTWESINS